MTLPAETMPANRVRVAFSYYVAILFEGIMLASLGPTLDSLADRSGSTLGRAGILFTANALGYIAGSLAAGRVYARRRGNPVLAISLVVMALLTGTIPLVNGLWLLICVFAGIGLAIGFIDVGGNSLIVWLFGREVPPYMNALHLSFGVGAFLAPLVIDLFAVTTGDATTAFWLFAVLMLPAAFWLTRVPSPERLREAHVPAGLRVARRHAVFIGLLALLFFMHVGAELAFGGWIFSYAEDKMIGPETTARVLNSMFWGGLVIGRLLAIPLSLRLSPAAMLRLDLAGAAASLGLIAWLPGWSPSLWIGTIGFGMAIASMFASCINYAEQRITITSEVTSVFLVGGSLGTMTLPWLVGRLFDSRGPEYMVYVVGAAILAAIALYTVIQTYSRGRPVDVGPAARQP